MKTATMKTVKMPNIFPVEVWKNWEKSGKSEFMKTCSRLVKADKKIANAARAPAILPHIVDLMTQCVLHGMPRKEAVVATLHELVALHTDVLSMMVDALYTVDSSTSELIAAGETRQRIVFSQLVKECDKIISDKLLKERLEIDSLQEVGILKNRSFYTKFIKIKTKLYYKQRKFNLFREENEGYAKLVTELIGDFAPDITPDYLLNIIQSLIGCFNLDPNRVLDIILECFENRPKDSPLFIPLIKNYMHDAKTICEVLGAKFNWGKQNTPVPRSLYILTAYLIQHDIIRLNEIYAWFTPEDKQMIKDWEKEVKDAQEYVRKLGIISLNKDKEEVLEERENPLDKYKLNQKLKLCEALVSVGAWEHTRVFITRLPEHYVVSFEPIAVAMCNLLHIIIEPVYRERFRIGRFKGKPLPPHDNPAAPKPARTFLELRDTALPMLSMLGPSLYHDPILLQKIVRLAKLALAEDNIDARKSAPEHDSLYYDIITLIDVSLLPSLSFLDCNCSVAEEIWSLIKLYPYQTRYALYGRWKNETYQIFPDLMRRRGDAEKRIKNIMKRVSKENIKPAGRIIGKLTHCSPGFLFDYVLVQIQVYDNLIHPVVDSLKYLTNLSYDVLCFCLIESLANADKKRVKHDSTSISSWLQSLSSFCGAVFKKYNIELTGLLQYVANQLKAQKSLDLLILKEIVQKMAGIETAEDLTMEQLNALCGGELLKVEAGYFSQVRNTKKSSQRLKDAMADHNLAVALCLLIAQQKYCIVYKETQQSHLKLVGKLFDQCQDTLVQFGTFLGSTLSVDEYVQKLPSIQSMLLEYHIPSEVAFFLARPMFNHAINIKYDQLRKADANYKKMPTLLKQQKYYEAACEVMAPVHGSLVPLHAAKVWDDVTPQFLTTFWSLTMYDLIVPEETYQQTISKIKQMALAVVEPNSSKGKKECERYQTLIEKLQDEKRKQQEHVEKVMHRLRQEKDTWFVSKYAKNDTITRFLHLCLFPRCTFTAIDAVYCAKFLYITHSLKTANFSTVLCYDRLFCDVTYSITSCTENEAMRYGRFILSMLETLMRWHKSKEVFDKECADFPGFVTKFRASDLQSDSVDQVGYEEFRHVCNKWHYRLTRALLNCLRSKEYVQIRNALIVLIKIIPCFPVLIKLGHLIEKKVEELAEEEKNNRQDIYTLAISYVGQLKHKLASGNVMRECEFHLVSEKDKEKQSKQAEAPKAEAAKQNGDGGGAIVKVESKEKKEEKKEKRQASEESRRSQAASPQESTPANSSSEKSMEKEQRSSKEESREKHHQRKEEKRDEAERTDREREREKRRERKEDKAASKDERQFREERSIEMTSPKEEQRYAPERQSDRYYEERHYYREAREERDGPVNNGTSSKHNQESTDPEREAKRRKMDGQSSKSYKHEERKMQQQQQQEQLQQQQLAQQQQQQQQPQQATEYVSEKPEKKERSAKNKDKREKMSDEEKELRKERKLGRKRDREEALLAEMKRKRDEEKASKVLAHQNGEVQEREKYHHSRELSPYTRERERSHDRMELREKHRRSTDSKRR